jgi:hypothetical protein
MDTFAAVVFCLSLPLVAAADDFDLYTGSVLAKAPSSDLAKPVEKLSYNEILRAAPVLHESSGCFVVVRTDDGNWSKLVLRAAIRKQGDAEQPIIVLERFLSLRPGTDAGRLAAGKDVYLFDKFRFNLDIGQVVPSGNGEDLVFHKQEGGGSLEATEKSKMYVLRGPLVSRPAGDGAGPSRGPVVPEDVAGQYRLVADGKWSGRLTINVSKSGEIFGSYVSDQSGGDYPVTGFVARPPHHVKFSIKLPAAEQEFDGRFWTRGKNAMAGTVTLTGLEFGFVAIREGTELMPKND